jgi:hypothetical protein
VLCCAEFLPNRWLVVEWMVGSRENSSLAQLCKGNTLQFWRIKRFLN